MEGLVTRRPAGSAARRRTATPYSTLDRAPWQCLNFLPDPHGQGSLRPTLRSPRTNVPCDSGTGGGGGRDPEPDDGIAPGNAAAPGTCAKAPLDAGGDCAPAD